MDSTKYIYWQGNNQWLGYLQDYPDYWTQGESFEDLQSHFNRFAELMSDCARIVYSIVGRLIMMEK
jgi:predicted RNase H-like HicB family nuclease